MKTGPALILSAIVILILPVATNSARGSLPTLTITANTTLTQNFAGQIVIGADNITLNCAGFSITGTFAGSDGSVGILLPARTLVTVKNCNIQGFNVGILLPAGSNGNSFFGNTASQNVIGYFLGSPFGPGANGNTFIGNTANNNIQGFQLSSSSNGNTLTNNVASNNRDFGIIVSGSNGNALKDNVANNEPFGFEFDSSSANAITNNAALNDNPGAGFLVFSGASNSLTNNQAENDNVGIQLESSSNNTVTNNVANSGFFGFVLRIDSPGTITTGNILSFNTAKGNLKYGFIIVAGPTGNTLSQNSACHNVIFDAFQAINGANTFTGNHFCTSNGIP